MGRPPVFGRAMSPAERKRRERHGTPIKGPDGKPVTEREVTERKPNADELLTHIGLLRSTIQKHEREILELHAALQAARPLDLDSDARAISTAIAEAVDAGKAFDISTCLWQEAEARAPELAAEIQAAIEAQRKKKRRKSRKSQTVTKP